MENTVHYSKQKRKQKFKISGTALGIIIISLIGGVLNGLIGAGGGIVLSLGFSALIGSFMKEKKDVYFNSQAAMIPVSVVSYFLYAASGETTSIPLWYMILPAVAGGVIGGIASSRINSKYIKLIFAAIVLFSGARMIFSALG